MNGDGDLLLSPNTNKVPHGDVMLLTAAEFLRLHEPHLLEIMLDARQALIENDQTATVIAKMWNAPQEQRTDYTLDTNTGIVLVAVPAYVWEAVYLPG